MLEIKKNESDMSLSFFIIKDNKIALSEMTILYKDLAIDYLKMMPNGEEKEKVAYLINNASKVYFFSRLNVPKALRGFGLGEALLLKTLDYMKETNSFLVNLASNYGEMGQENLIEFYQKNGMKLIHKDGFLIYHSDLENKVKFKP